MQLRSALADTRTVQEHSRPWHQRDVLSALGVVAALLLWAVSLLQIDPAGLGDLGLLDVLPLSFYASLAVLTVSFCAAVCRERFSSGVLFAHLAAFIVIIHVTPELVYNTLRYAWAWKHVGIIDFILRHGAVDRTVLEMNAYHNWPGFFAANALLTRAAGLGSALPYAGWGPLAFNVLNLGALLLLFRALLRSERHVWAALWFVTITSWVGQDYFSPQAFAFFLHLVILGIVARWFCARRPVGGWPAPRLNVSPARSLGALPSPLPLWQVSRSVVAAALALLVGLFAALASSHQLTPVVTALSLGVLTLFSRNRALGLPLLMALFSVGWMVYGATPFFSDTVGELVASFGRLSGNVDETLYNLTEFSREQRLVALTGRTLTLAVWALACLGIVRHLLGERPNWSLILLTGVPFLLLAANSYGGEMVFRVYLFALPFVGLWTAYLVGFGLPNPGWWRRFLPTLGLSAVLLSGFLVAYYGKETQYYFSPDEVRAAEVLYDAAPEGSLIVEGTRNYPSRYRDYEFYTHVALSYEPPASQEEVLADPAVTLRRWLDDSSYSATFVFLTQSQKAEAEGLGPLPSGSLDAIEAALSASPDFEVLYRNGDAVIFTLAGRAQGVGP